MRKAIISLFRNVVSHYGQAVLQHRSALVVCLQLGLIAAANVTAFALRFDGDVPPDQVQLLLSGLPVVLAICMASLIAFGIQRGLWRYVDLHDLGRILWATVTSSVVLYGVLHGLFGWVAYPRWDSSATCAPTPSSNGATHRCPTMTTWQARRRTRSSAALRRCWCGPNNRRSCLSAARSGFPDA